MAKISKSLSYNVEGNFFVDNSCIDCDACRQIAPEIFGDNYNYAYIKKQPNNEKETKKTVYALLSCPVNATGLKESKEIVKKYINDFPILIEDNVYFNGYNSKKSYGANSYFIKDINGNWLVESPRFAKPLVKKFENLGGLKYIYLTHRDDIADTKKYADYFNAKVIIHEGDLSAYPYVDFVLKGTQDTQIGEDFLIIYTPGHTKGHTVLLYKNKFLFTGDHLFYNREKGKLDIFKNYCWYSLKEQIKSIEKLLNYEFEWILTGHGQSIKLDTLKIKKDLAEIV